MSGDLGMELAIAVVTGVLAVVGAYAGNMAVSRKKSQEAAIRDAERDTKLEVRLEHLGKKIDEHNSYGRKIGEIQADIAAIKKDIEYLRRGKE